MMKVVLIQGKYFNIWEAIGCAYLGAMAKRKFGSTLNMSFYQGYFDSDDKIIKAAMDADIVGFSCTSPAYSHCLSIAKKIKRLNSSAYTVFGGWHSSTVPKIIEEFAIDCVVVGEGDLVFSEIIDGRREKIIYADPVKNIDSLPHPDRELIKNHREIDLAQKMTSLRIASFQSVRGCPRNCVFCSEHAVSGKLNKNNPLRVRSANNLIGEINYVVAKYGLNYFKFVDPTWNISEKKVIEFCEEKMKTGNKTPWECNLHASLATKTMLKVMKDAGCCQINIGCESGSPKILKDMKKGLTIEKVKQVFEWGREVGLKRRAFFILGMPNETEEDIRMTENLIDEIRPDVFGMTILCPYPGSSLYSKKYSNIDWSKTDEYSNNFWRSKTLTNQGLKRWQQYFVAKYQEKICWHNKEVN